jgi:phosphoribosylformimino-5-aminoimidazole carboxamide ribotide isomerase
MELIPSIDLRGGQCVRLLQGDFRRETRYEFAPHELLLRYRNMGARWLHVVDLDGARDGRLANREILLALASQSGLLLQVGGGVRQRAIVDDLLAHGVDRVIVGSAAVEAPDEVRSWLAHCGAEKIGLAFDVKLDRDNVPKVQTRGWTRATQLTLWDAVASFLAAGLRHVLCTDVARDGALGGPNIELYREAQRRYPQIAWQASGGIRDVADLASLAQLGVAAAISGKALIEERLRPEDLKPWLPGTGTRVSQAGAC